MAQIELSQDQEKIREAIVEFAKSDKELLTIGGFAGTGKTTVVSESIRSLGPDRPEMAFCAFSGKAASVLRGKLLNAGVLRETDYCGTIHGLIYALTRSKLKGEISKVQIEEEGKRTPIKEKMEMDLAFQKSGLLKKGTLVVMDEASMTGEDIFMDLMETGARVIAVGDHGQLPPVKASNYLMKDPMIKLEKIHRQAEGDPIIRVSRMAREDGKIPVGEYGDLVRKVRRTGDMGWSSPIQKDWMMLCGRNTTRVFWNNELRRRFGFTEHDVMVGERVICLKNNRDFDIFNGMLGKVTAVSPDGSHWYKMAVQMDGGVQFAGSCLKHQFGSQSTCYSYPPGALDEFAVGNLFDWGWCVTVHKSQGSEWDSVCVIEERFMPSNEDWCRWLYTAVTRAKKELLVVGS